MKLADRLMEVGSCGLSLAVSDFDRFSRYVTVIGNQNIP